MTHSMTLDGDRAAPIPTTAAGEARQALGGLFRAAGSALAAGRERWHQYHRFREEIAFLASLPDRELADMGFTRYDIDRSRRLGRWVRARDED